MLQETIRTFKESLPEGFSKVEQGPTGKSGFVSKIGGGVYWHELGMGQNSVEMEKVARAFHIEMVKPNSSPQILGILASQLVDYSKPK